MKSRINQHTGIAENVVDRLETAIHEQVWREMAEQLNATKGFWNKAKLKREIKKEVERRLKSLNSEEII